MSNLNLALVKIVNCLIQSGLNHLLLSCDSPYYFCSKTRKQSEKPVRRSRIFETDKKYFIIY